MGANIFIGNLDPEVDEKLLYDTFSAFGVILQTPKVCRTQTYISHILNVYNSKYFLDNEGPRKWKFQRIRFC